MFDQSKVRALVERKLINSARHLRWCFKDDPDLAEIRFNQGFNPEPF